MVQGVKTRPSGATARGSFDPLNSLSTPLGGVKINHWQTSWGRTLRGLVVSCNFHVFKRFLIFIKGFCKKHETLDERDDNEGYSLVACVGDKTNLGGPQSAF